MYYEVRFGFAHEAKALDVWGLSGLFCTRGYEIVSGLESKVYNVSSRSLLRFIDSTGFESILSHESNFS